MILMVKKLLEGFMKKKLQKTNQKEFRIEKVINYMLNRKVMIIHQIVGLIKRIWCHSIGCNYMEMSRCFPKEYKQFGKNINSKIELSNYATKADIKNILHFDTSSFA